MIEAVGPWASCFLQQDVKYCMCSWKAPNYSPFWDMRWELKIGTNLQSTTVTTSTIVQDKLCGVKPRESQLYRLPVYTPPTKILCTQLCSKNEAISALGAPNQMEINMPLAPSPEGKEGKYWKNHCYGSWLIQMRWQWPACSTGIDGHGTRNA